MRVGFERRYSRVWSRSFNFVVMFNRWEVLLKLAYSISALSRCTLIVSFDAMVTGSSHLHCVRMLAMKISLGSIPEGMPDLDILEFFTLSLTMMMVDKGRNEVRNRKMK